MECSWKGCEEPRQKGHALCGHSPDAPVPGLPADGRADPSEGGRCLHDAGLWPAQPSQRALPALLHRRQAQGGKGMIDWGALSDEEVAQQLGGVEIGLPRSCGKS